MSDAQIEAYYEGVFELTPEDVIPVIKAAGPIGLTDREVADRLLSGEIPKEQFYSLQQECVRICGDLFYDGLADREKRPTIVDGEPKTRSFYWMRETPCEPRERPGEKKVREATEPLHEQIRVLKEQLDQAVRRGLEYHQILEGLTAPTSQSTGG